MISKEDLQGSWHLESWTIGYSDRDDFTYPYGEDPEDRNLRIAPSYANFVDLKAAMQILVICVKLATLRDELKNRG